MNVLLLAFALPVATILLAIVLQKILKCPLLVAAAFFAGLLIITFAVLDTSFLVFAIIYTILAYVTAVLTRLVCRIINQINPDTTRNDPVVILTNSNNIVNSNGNNSARVGRNCCNCFYNRR